jgi:hypothetical protein
VLAAAVSPTTRDDELRTLVAGIDVDALLGLADHHKVTALLHQRLATVADVPSQQTEELARSSQAAGAVRLHALRTLKALDASIDVPYIVVKGPVLATHWYDDPARREFSDLDVLVDPSDFVHVIEQMSATGFEPLATNWHGFLEHGVAEVPLGFESSAVDLHWNLVALGRTRLEIQLSTVDRFDAAERIAVDGLEVLSLDPTDTLLHLCVNSGLDGARRLRSLVDIDTVVRSGRADVDLFVERAQRAGAAPLSAAVLQRTRTVLGTPVPPDLLRQLATSRVWMTANRMVDGLGSAGRRDNVAHGLLLASGRRTLRATGLALARSSAEKLPQWTGRTVLSGDLGELSWQRTPDDGDIATHRARYLEFVEQQA